jgi:hypothetical protein
MRTALGFIQEKGLIRIYPNVSDLISVPVFG